MFDNVKKNIVINLIYPTCIESELKDLTCSKIDTTSDWKLNQKKINGFDDSCMDNCTGDFEFENNGKCYPNCTHGYYINNTKKYCKCELEQCYLCPPVAFQKGLCSLCNEGYYPKENDPLNLGQYFNCYKDPIGYYLDTNDYLYKKIINKQDETDKINIPEETNNNHIKKFCDTNNPFENIVTEECVRYCSINKIINKICILNYKIDESQNYNKEYAKIQDILLENVEIGLKSEEFNTLFLENGGDNLIQTEKMLIRLTTTDNQNNNINKNTTTIILGDECESLLRSTYNITGKIFMKKIDVEQDKMRIPKIEYDIYAKINGTTLSKLNKSICQNTKITLNIPIELSENLDTLNTSSGYFNDLCYTTTSEDGTDISLKDRKDDYIQNNKTVCQDDCDFDYYDKDTHLVKCSCDVNEKVISFANMAININKLSKNFKNIENIANIHFLKCFKTLFNKDGLLYNIGFYIILLILIFSIICVFIFYLYHIFLIKQKINDLLSGIKNITFKKKSKNKKTKKKLNNSRNKINEENNSNNLKIKTKKKKKKKKKKKIKDYINLEENSDKKENSKKGIAISNQDNSDNIKDNMNDVLKMKNNNVPFQSKPEQIEIKNDTIKQQIKSNAENIMKLKYNEIK